MFSTSPESQRQKQTRTRITSSGWAWSSCSSLGGALNSADKAVLGGHRCQRIAGCPPPDPARCITGKHYAARYAVRCHLLYS